MTSNGTSGSSSHAASRASTTTSRSKTQTAGPSSSRTQSFHGTGLAILRSHPAPGSAGKLGCTFSHLRFSFPLKLISPRTTSRDATTLIAKARAARDKLDRNDGGVRLVNGGREPQGTAQSLNERWPVAVVYIIGYGGGLVSGDCVDLDVDVGERCTMLLLTQGSTKVFKMKVPSRPRLQPETSEPDQTCRQNLRFLLRPSSTLILLPDPVTCFTSSRYTQVQRFDLQCPLTSSLILLDWFTPGRQFLSTSNGRATYGENWNFESYQSRNEVRVDGKVVMRDVLDMSQPPSECLKRDVDLHGPTLLAKRNAPYTCYASLFLLGPDSQPTIRKLEQEWREIQQRTLPTTGSSGRSIDPRQSMPVIWSMSVVAPETGSMATTASGAAAASSTLSSTSTSNGPSSPIQAAVVRIAGMETETVREWLRTRLVALQDVVGQDLYRAALGG